MRPLRSSLNGVILSGFAFGAAALYVGFPEAGIVPLGALMIAFLLPATILVTDALLRGLCVSHAVDDSGSSTALRIYDAIMMRVAVFLTGVHATILLAVFGVFGGRPWSVQIVPVMLGLTMISVGNLLPRTRPNLAVGIRTRRTLANRALWIRTHRTLGYMVVALGFVLVLSALALPPPVGPGMILLAGPAALLATCFVVWQSGRHADVHR